MKDIIPNGTEVLIFKYIKEWEPNQNEDKFITGTVISSEESDDLSYHGSAWYEQIYKVLGEDGKHYSGTYGSGLIGNSYFRTREDHIKVLEGRIRRNEETIINLQDKNTEYQKQINSLIEKSPKQIKKSFPKQ